MKLILEITRIDDEFFSSREYTFNSSSGIIGRDMGADIYLEDSYNYISSRHAKIEYKDDRYYITDISTNGTYYKATNQRLQSGMPISMQNNDIFVVNKYELKAKIIEDDYINYEISKEMQINALPNFQEIIAEDFLFSDDSIIENTIISQRDNKNESILDIFKSDVDDFKKVEDDFLDMDTVTNEIQYEHISINVYNDHQEINSQENSELLNILENELDIELKNLDLIDQKIAIKELASIVKISLDSLKKSLQLKSKIEKEIIKKEDNFLIINAILEEENILKRLSNQKNDLDIKEEIKNSFEELNNYCYSIHKANQELIQTLTRKDVSLEQEYKNSFTNNLDNENII